MRRVVSALALTALVLTGCADTEDAAETETPPASSSPTASDSPTPDDTGTATLTETPTEAPTGEPNASGATTVEIEIEGDRIEPNGKRLKVAVGETVLLDVESDRAAQLHVHSSPEQVLEIEPGESTLELAIDRPGLVDVEEHETGLVLLQLEVR